MQSKMVDSLGIEPSPLVFQTSEDTNLQQVDMEIYIYINGANARIRTENLLFIQQVLYQLSYSSLWLPSYGSNVDSSGSKPDVLPVTPLGKMVR